MSKGDDATELNHRAKRLVLTLSESAHARLSELLSESDEKVASVLKRGLALYGDTKPREIGDRNPQAD